MKITESKCYWGDSIWGNFFNKPDSHKLAPDTLVLINTITSYKLDILKQYLSYFTSIKYKIIGETKRKWFKYRATVARVVPIHERLIINEGWVEIEGWKERYDEKKKENPNHPLRWDDVYIKVKMNVDEVRYTDKDLELMRDWKKVDTSMSPTLQCKIQNGVKTYTLTTYDGKVYEAYKGEIK